MSFTISSTTTFAPNTASVSGSFNPKKAGSKTSHVIIVLDDSYSMRSIRDNTISGFNEYIGGQKIDALNTGIKTSLSLYKFDGTNVNQVYNKVNINDVQPLTRETYNPQGSTNLLDAIGGVMMQINTDLIKQKKTERESVIITILTDGEENTSRTFSKNDIKAMIEKAESKNWGFMFLGTNIDAFSEGAALGFKAHNTLQFNSANIQESIRSASLMTSRMKSAYSTGAATGDVYVATAFTDAERSSSNGEA